MYQNTNKKSSNNYCPTSLNLKECYILPWATLILSANVSSLISMSTVHLQVDLLRLVDLQVDLLRLVDLQGRGLLTQGSSKEHLGFVDFHVSCLNTGLGFKHVGKGFGEGALTFELICFASEVDNSTTSEGRFKDGCLESVVPLPIIFIIVLAH